MDFSAFAAVESSRARQQAERLEQFEVHYLKALDYLMRFQEQNCFHQPYLQKAVHELLAAIPHQRGRVEPYAWLAYAMYILEKDILFKDYFQIACSIDSKYKLLQALNRVTAEKKAVTRSAFSAPPEKSFRADKNKKKKPVLLNRGNSMPDINTGINTRLKSFKQTNKLPETETIDLFSGDFSLQDI